MTVEDIFIKLQSEFPALTRAEIRVKDYPTWSVPVEAVRKICEALRSEFSFDYLDMITAVDRSGPVDPGGYPTAPNPDPYAGTDTPISPPTPSVAGVKDKPMAVPHQALCVSSGRFEIIYLLTALSSGIKICLRCPATGETPLAPSLCDVFMAADWQEREIYDLFGIIFEGHPNLQKILTPETLIGHPLRKDYIHVPDNYD